MAGIARKRKVEDPDRLARFMSAVSGQPHAEEPLQQRLTRIASALDDLITAEVRYYYRSRKRHARVSSLCRVAAWITGTVGLLMPLVGAALVQYASIAAWGYVFLGASAAALAANSLFGGSATHARNTSAQLELERLLLRFRLSWLRIEMAGQSEGETASEAFALFEQFSEDTANVISAETTQWSSALQRAIDSYGVSAASPVRR
jgi:hypothetical protein